MNEQNKYAHVCWTASDIQTLAPKMSNEAAEEWLADNANRIQERLTELGWETISILLAMDGQDTSDGNEDGDGGEAPTEVVAVDPLEKFRDAGLTVILDGFPPIAGESVEEYLQRGVELRVLDEGWVCNHTAFLRDQVVV